MKNGMINFPVSFHEISIKPTRARGSASHRTALLLSAVWYFAILRMAAGQRRLSDDTTPLTEGNILGRISRGGFARAG